MDTVLKANVNLSIQRWQWGELAELRRDCASELIREEVPATRRNENTPRLIRVNPIKHGSFGKTIVKAIINVQVCEFRKVAELRRDGASELIRVEVPGQDNEDSETLRLRVTPLKINI